VSCSIPTATPGINQHSPTRKKNQKLNNKQRTENEQVAEGWGAISALEKGEVAKRWTLCKHSINKGRKGRRADSQRMISHCLK
jgi:hypothetical protein